MPYASLHMLGSCSCVIAKAKRYILQSYESTRLRELSMQHRHSFCAIYLRTGALTTWATGVTLRWTMLLGLITMCPVVSTAIDDAEVMLVTNRHLSSPSASDIASRVDAAISAYAEGRFDAAATMFEDVLALLPESAEAHLWLARCREHSARPSDAVAAYSAYLRIRPLDAVTWINLADLQGRTGNKDGEVLALERAVALEPDNGLILKRLSATRPSAAIHALPRNTSGMIPFGAEQASKLETPVARTLWQSGKHSGPTPSFDVVRGLSSMMAALAAIISVLALSPLLARTARKAGRATILVGACVVAGSLHFALWGQPRNLLGAVLTFAFAISLGRLASGAVKK